MMNYAKPLALALATLTPATRLFAADTGQANENGRSAVSRSDDICINYALKCDLENIERMLDKTSAPIATLVELVRAIDARITLKLEPLRKELKNIPGTPEDIDAFLAKMDRVALPDYQKLRMLVKKLDQLVGLNLNAQRSLTLTLYQMTGECGNNGVIDPSDPFSPFGDLQLHQLPAPYPRPTDVEVAKERDSLLNFAKNLNVRLGNNTSCESLFVVRNDYDSLFGIATAKVTVISTP